MGVRYAQFERMFHEWGSGLKGLRVRAKVKGFRGSKVQKVFSPLAGSSTRSRSPAMSENPMLNLRLIIGDDIENRRKVKGNMMKFSRVNIILDRIYRIYRMICLPRYGDERRYSFMELSGQSG